MSILEIFKKPARTAAELRKKLAEIDAEIPSMKTLCDAAEAERGRALLTLGDREIEVIEGKLARARRDLDRAVAARETLERQAAEAEEREKAERLETIRREAEDLAATTARDLRLAYAELGLRLAIILEAARRVDEKIREASQHLREGGRAEGVETVADRVALRSGVGLALDLFSTTSIAPVGGSPGWGQARIEAERIGLDVTVAQ